MMYTLERLQKHYGQKPVLDINTLQIEEGEILGLVGSNGSGKSTLLRHLAFLEAAQSGNQIADAYMLRADDEIAIQQNGKADTHASWPGEIDIGFQRVAASLVHLGIGRSSRRQCADRFDMQKLIHIRNTRSPAVGYP